MNNTRLAIGAGNDRPVEGFTLIELLVVVSIIALLVSILVPALTEARELATGVVCLARLRGIGIATALYQGENNDSLLPTVPPIEMGLGYLPWWWQALLARYLYDFELDMSNPTNPVEAAGGYWDPVAGSAYHQSLECPGEDPFYMEVFNINWPLYAINDRGHCDYAVTGWPNVPRKITDVPQPASLISVADSINWILDWPYAYGYLGWAPYFWEHSAYTSARHLGKTNIVFLDGHAEAMSYEDYEWDGFFWLPSRQ